MAVKVIIILSVLLVGFVNCRRSNEAIDSAFLESVLDAEECDRQVRTIRRNLLLMMEFADAGIRLPKGILIGSTTDLGNYHQCLNIEHLIDGMDIQGKFCSIRVPVNQSFHLPGFDYAQYPWTLSDSELYSVEEKISKLDKYSLGRAQLLAMGGDFKALEEYHSRTVPPNPLSSTVFTLGVCVPRPCTTQQAITSLLFNITAVGFEYTENYCRLRGDKPWSGADYAAIVVFSFIGFITLLSTCYDLIHRFVIKADIKTINPIYQSFSVYTNSQRIVSNTATGSLQCMDGIRTISMLWIIIGHSFGSEPHAANPIDTFLWMFSLEGLWLTMATAAVDTFFVMGGILLLYTAAGKMSGSTFLKNLHWFYLNRIIRITPLLAAAVLLEASFYNQLTDGPSWGTVAYRTNTCRENWWYTLLHVQNLIIPNDMCVGHSWYIAIDMHVYVLSPLILYWVFTGKKRSAWIALTSGLVVTLILSTVYNYMKNFQAGILALGSRESGGNYMADYYFNTLTRASPFFVGLIFGYVLHLYRGRKVNLPWIVALIFWMCSIGVVGGIFYFHYLIMQFDWDNEFLDNFMNSFMRPAWACVIGWMIFACVHGFGGPINWFLSLDIWRIPARLTYGMYLFHYPLMFAINGTMISPIYFTVGLYMFKSLSYLVLSVVMSYILTVTIDSPFAALFKQIMIKVQQKSKPLPEPKVEKEDYVENGEHLKAEQSTDGEQASEQTTVNINTTK